MTELLKSKIRNHGMLNKTFELASSDVWHMIHRGTLISRSELFDTLKMFIKDDLENEMSNL